MAHVTSLRLPDELFEQLTPILSRHGKSLNAFVTESIRRAILAEEEREMYEAATLLGEDADCDVEYALQAQSEIAGKD